MIKHNFILFFIDVIERELQWPLSSQSF